MPDGSVILEWTSIVGESYGVESSSQLDASDWILHGSVTAKGQTTNFTTGARVEEEEYFRVRLIRGLRPK